MESLTNKQDSRWGSDLFECSACGGDGQVPPLGLDLGELRERPVALLEEEVPAEGAEAFDGSEGRPEPLRRRGEGGPEGAAVAAALGPGPLEACGVGVERVSQAHLSTAVGIDFGGLRRPLKVKRLG